MGRALEGLGYRIVRQVGVSGYRVDLAILSEDGSGIDLVIECDGATYHSAPAARDRDWLREEVLKGLGWQIHRVWSTSWVRNTQGEMDAIEMALNEARSRPAIPFTPDGHTKSERNSEDILEAKHLPMVEPVESEPSPEFRVYAEASLEGLANGPQLQYQTQGNLGPMIKRVAQVEGPVHVDIVIERIRVHYQLSRVRGSTREKVINAIDRAAREGLVKKEENIIWTEDDQLDQPPRLPAQEKVQRSIELIPTGELRTAILFSVKEIFGGSREDVVFKTARNLGYQRTGPSISKILDEIITQMLERGDLGESFGMIVVAE